MIECVSTSAALTAKLNWGSGEKQSNASAPGEEEEATVRSRTPPRTLRAMWRQVGGKKKRGRCKRRRGTEGADRETEMRRLMACNDETDEGRGKRDAHIRGHYSSATHKDWKHHPRVQEELSTTHLSISLTFLFLSVALVFIPPSICASVYLFSHPTLHSVPLEV